MLRLTLALGVMLSMGCALFRPTPEQIALTGGEAFSQRWTGLPEDDVLLHYGKPDEVLQLSNGNRVIGYHREVAVSRSRGFANQYAAASSSGSTTIYCDRRFEVDRDNGKVSRAVIVGSSCDYNR